MAWRLVPLGTSYKGTSCEIEIPSKQGPALYYVEEILALGNRLTPTAIEEMHKAKLAFPGFRVIQEGPEKKS